MSLDYWLDKIEDYENVVWIPAPTEEDPEAVDMNPVTHVLIFSTMTVGLGEISRKNIDEFVARYRIIERLDGPFLRDGEGKARFVTDVEFLAHIGLRTNVSNETRAQWTSRMFGNKPTSKTNEIARQFKRANHNVAVI
jgi:hypothetical protein